MVGLDDLTDFVFCVLLAVKHMASSLAVEWAKKGVRVNCLRYVSFLFLFPPFYFRRSGMLIPLSDYLVPDICSRN